MKKIALLHTVKSVYASFQAMLEKEIKDISVTNMVDEFLVTNAREKGYFPPENRRKLYLDLLSLSAGMPDVIAVTCSSLTPFAEELRSSFDVPVLLIDDRMCRDAAAIGGNIAVLATAPTTVDPTVSRIRMEAEKLGVSPVIKSYLDTKAMDMLNLGDVQGHDARLAALARTATDADVIVLAQASMATAANLVREATGKKVLTSPGSCIEDIKAALAK